MTGLFEFLWGLVWGSLLTLAVMWDRVRREKPKHSWKCPEPGCGFTVDGTQEGLVDYVILEHSAGHE